MSKRACSDWLRIWSSSCLIITAVLWANSSTTANPPPKILSEKGRKELSKNITHILNQLVNPKLYDKRLRPNYGGPPVDVGITIYVSSISAVSEVEMDFTLDFYLRQMWTDPRLGFLERYGLNKDLTVGVEYLTHIWVPDTFFPNEKKSFFHEATTHNSFLRIKANGEIWTSQRLTVTANCPMQLQLFPLDSQKCSLEIESYGYSTTDIRYTWFKGFDSVKYDEVSLPQFQLSDFYIDTDLAKLSTGDYSRLIVQFMFTRQIGFYMIQIYLPSILIVIISWVSFWLSRDATPARVSLGVTTVLTMTTLMTTTNAAMPKVSYIKSIDIYLGTCFLMVFASLLEYAMVGYLNKKLRMKQEARRKQRDGIGGLGNSIPASTFGPRPMFSGPTSPNPGIRLPLLPVNNVRINLSEPACLSENSKGGVRYSQLFGGPPGSTTQIMPECDCDLSSSADKNNSFPSAAPRSMKLTPPPKKQKLMAVYPSSIDKYSRIVFPLGFAAFNAMYWTIYMHISEDKLQKDEGSTL